MTSPGAGEAASAGRVGAADGAESAGAAEGSASVRIEAFGDAAVLLTLDERVDPRLAVRARAIAAAVDAARMLMPDVGRPIAAHASVLVPFDPLAVEIADVIGMVEKAVDAEPAPLDPEPGPPIQIGVRYGGPDGPDLEALAAFHGLRPDDVIELHASATYAVLFLGFAPGFAYLGGLPSSLVTPRRTTPRVRVPAGSVGIAGEQTGVYPLAMPGGWQLIGRTDDRLWDETRSSPTLVRPGDRVRFVPIP